MRILLLLFILLAAPVLQAQILDEYQATAKVDNQGAAARDKALREALSSVLARISGQPAINASGRTGPILARASAMIRSVSYQSTDDDTLQLVAVFNPDAVDSALKQQGLPVHGVTSGASEQLRLSIAGISNAQDYARVMTYLGDQPGVKNLTVAMAGADTLVVNLRADGGAARLAGALSVGGVMRREGEVAENMQFVLRR